MYVFSPAVLFGLQLLGLLPVSVNHLPLRGGVAGPSRPLTVYSILLVIFYCTMLCLWMLEFSGDAAIISYKSFKITSICSLTTSFLASVVAVGVSAKSVKQKILLIEKLREIDFHLQHKFRPPKSRRLSVFIITFVLSFFIVEVILILYALYRDNINSFKAMTYVTLEYFKLVILFGILEVMELVLAVRERFQMVNERVLEVVMRNRSKRLLWTVALPCVETFTMPQEMKMSIPELNEIHWNLCFTVCEINTIYGYHLVTTMIFIFTHLVYCPYLMFVLIDNKHRDWSFIGTVLIWMILTVSKLFLVVLPCSLTVKEANTTIVTVTKLLGLKMGKQVFNELQTFAEQLLHRDVEFSAGGLFTLQMSMVVSVASAVTTYLAIIIQFQASADDRRETGGVTPTSTVPITPAH